MNRNSMKKILSLLLCVVLIAAMALMATGCSGEPAFTEQPNTQGSAPTDAGSSEPDPSQQQDSQVTAPTEVGEGNAVFYFSVVDDKGKQTDFKVRTNEKTVGAALVAEGLIQGEEGPYGLYVKTVLGVTLDYEKDGKFWAFYENGASALKGVDQTDITPEASYAFKAE